MYIYIYIYVYTHMFIYNTYICVWTFMYTVYIYICIWSFIIQKFYLHLAHGDIPVFINITCSAPAAANSAARARALYFVREMLGRSWETLTEIYRFSNYTIRIPWTKISGWWLTYPCEKYDFVNWDDEIPNMMGKS